MIQVVDMFLQIIFMLSGVAFTFTTLMGLCANFAHALGAAVPGYKNIVRAWCWFGGIMVVSGLGGLFIPGVTA